MTIDKPVIFVIGGPGSGKGTQCEKIIKKYGFTHLSTGDLLREAVASGSEHGKRLNAIMQSGQLVPLEEVLTLLKNSMEAKNGTSNGFLIDGYPRELDQAIEFEKNICKCTFLFFFDLNDKAMVERLLERGKKSGRVDDNQETIKKRLDTFHTHTDPILNYFGDRVIKVNCDRDVDSIFAEVIDQLYQHSSANCLAVLRELPLLGKHYVLRLLFIEQGFPQSMAAKWIIPDSIKEHNEVAAKMKALRIWFEMQMPGGGLPGFILNDVFRSNLKTALLGGGDNWSLVQTADTDKYARDAAFVNKYALDRWECILQFMVGNQTEQISTDTIKTLINAEYIDYDASKPNASPKITANGFQFLLMSTNAQVWYFILHYLDTIEAKGFDFVECLSFLFQLSFSTVGRDYLMEGLSQNILGFLQNLREFGFIYQRKRKDGRFYPTKLVANLTSSSKVEMAADSKEGYLIVETNYRVYAYTDSPLQTALLSLFVDLKYRFPKFCLGLLTRESVRRALRSGITADQMINFLNINLHADMQKSKGKKRQIPPTVIDQIKLWEIERDRFTFKDGVLYSQFLSQNDFELLRNYASDCNHLIWDNPAKRVMVVTNNGHDDVRKFWKRSKKEH